MTSLLDEMERLAKAATPGGVCPYYDEHEQRWNITGDIMPVSSDDADLIEKCSPEYILALVKIARASIELVAIAEKQLHPTPDKPNTAWSKMRALQEALSSLPHQPT